MRNSKILDKILFYMLVPLLPILDLLIRAGCFSLKLYIWMKEQRKIMDYDTEKEKHLHNMTMGKK